MSEHTRRIEREKKQRWRVKNRTKVREDNAAWKKAHPDVDAFHTAKRRAAKLRATPSWSVLEEVQSIYKQAASLQKLLRRKLHVDHIVPLQGKLVSGLHVPHNLQIMFAEDNMSKSNNY